MLIIQFNKEEKKDFLEIFHSATYDKNFIEPKKLSGDEVLLQAIITSVNIAAPYIIDFYIRQKKKKKKITLIRKGVKITFDNVKDLKEFLKEYNMD